jgi:hypothetical protein
MSAALVILAAIVLAWFWVRYTIKTFAAIARNLWRVAIEVRHIVRMLTAPRCTELDRFLDRRARAARGEQRA